MRQTEFFIILGHFLPYQPHDNPERQNFKTERNTSRYYHLTHWHYKWQSYDVLTPYGPRKSKFWKTEKNTWRHHFPNVYHKWESYDVWFRRCEVQRTEFFAILLFYHPINPKNQNFEKMKKKKNSCRYHHFIHVYTKNDNHMMYVSWDMKSDGQNVLSFGRFFAILTT